MVDAWKRDSLYAVIAYSVPVRLSVTVLPLPFLRLRVHVYSPMSIARACVSLTRVRGGILVDLDSFP